MSLKKFGSDDVIINTMRAHPSSEFVIFDGRIFYDSIPVQSGAFTGSVLSVSGGTGHISLYEYNIDRSTGQGTAGSIADGTLHSKMGNHFIKPFVIKNSNLLTIPSPSPLDSKDDFSWFHEWGDQLTGSYPLSASITREYMSTAGDRKTCYGKWDTSNSWKCYPEYPHYWALKNRLNSLAARSIHYKVTSSYGIKDQQTINLISIPSIFYGSKIKPGTVSLKWYFTGSLIGELQDTKRNGELIQITASDAPYTGDGTGSVAGVVLYDEGFVLLTGSWAMNGSKIPLISGSTTTYSPSWIFFGAGANDSVSQPNTSVNSPATPSADANTNFKSASFSLSFKGHTETQVLTMFAHARRGEANYSNNPTFLEYGQDQLRLTSSQVYEENTERRIKNTVSSSYSDYSASFKRQVYISKVAIYDDSKNLIGIATLSNPVLKEEDQDLAFKIRLDI
jgi:hypothetical protein